MRRRSIHVWILLLLAGCAPGISVRPLVQMTGDAQFCEVFCDGLRVLADMTVGAPGAG